MKTIDFSYFIERFIAGEMDEKEKQWFLKEMEGNHELRREVDLRRKTDKLVGRQDIVDLRKKLAAIEQKRAALSESHKSGRIKYAAVIAAFVIIGGAILLSRGRPGPDELFDRYYKPYEPTLSVRSGLKSGNQDFNLALEYYKVHDYRNAAVYFSKVVQKEPEDMHSTLLNGISNFEISNYPEAENSFVRVIDDDDNLFIDHAQWYLSMCYIKTDEMTKAKDQLALIAASESMYRKNAKQILKRLQ
ncbi:MAG: hypothetical protein GYA41_01695 [Bacteroidales bacterium]|nr:hypothetical protein [Bacteroidales bacterium]